MLTEVNNINNINNINKMYAKLFSRITESSLIEEDITTRWVFVALLAIAESDGSVIGTDIAIARRINVPLTDFEKSMGILMAPDLNSNNQDFDGARVIRSAGERGYYLTGYARYRSLKTEDERRQYMKEYMAKKRANVNSVNFQLAQLTHAEAEAEAEAEEIKKENVFSPDSQKLVNDLISLMLDNDPKARIPKNTDSWLKQAELLWKKDGRELEEAMAVLNWCKKDRFWSSNILSMVKFRQQYPRLREQYFSSKKEKPKPSIVLRPSMDEYLAAVEKTSEGKS